ncbi:hypothetical protein PAXRUDRAFT_699279 [Paxillus rubicundulus Ve08.2h10]|uniref:Unplaced genomic scaffold scaffold_756, whole genome shotgun sequence n=1 Tax=Paxillus rubicundulus Ve08.2h10 TaxID=930991 RepID=A0A0D0DH05_9AGAM|nr:hypothetical protein PAXRUDRAFT_699279 [Paxillus rubicundulus Ve08.2h10]
MSSRLLFRTDCSLWIESAMSDGISRHFLHPLSLWMVGNLQSSLQHRCVQVPHFPLQLLKWFSGAKFIVLVAVSSLAVAQVVSSWCLADLCGDGSGHIVMKFVIILVQVDVSCVCCDSPK